MPKPSPAKKDLLTADLAEEVRASEPLFIEEAVKAFRERIKMEYPRLRGYAMESGTNCIELQISLFCNFDERWFRLTTKPTFTPAPGSVEKTVPMPKLERG